MGGGDVSLDQWPILLEQWLREQDLLTVDPAVAVAAPQGLPLREPGEHLTKLAVPDHRK